MKTFLIRTICAIVFLAFTFSYVYIMQADYLTFVQHVWSGGQTHFNALIGAALLTLVLVLLQRLTNILTSLPLSAKALTYFPSFLLLSVITCGTETSDGRIDLGNFWWVAIILLVLYAFVCSILSELKIMENRITRFGPLSQIAWCNYTIMALMMMMTLLVGNTDPDLHLTTKIENKLAEEDYSTVTSLIAQRNKADATTTMILAYALSKQQTLGDSLFCYPIEGGAQALIPQPDHSSAFRICNNELIWRHLGSVPKADGNVDVITFLKLLNRKDTVNAYAKDYLLTAYLLNKDLAPFIKEIGTERMDSVYPTLPAHYREAVILFKHTDDPNGLITISDSLLENQFNEYAKDRHHPSRRNYWTYFNEKD